MQKTNHLSIFIECLQRTGQTIQIQIEGKTIDYNPELISFYDIRETWETNQSLYGREEKTNGLFLFRIAYATPAQSSLFLEYIQVHLCQRLSNGPCLSFQPPLAELYCNKKKSTKPTNKLNVYPQYGAR